MNVFTMNFVKYAQYFDRLIVFFANLMHKIFILTHLVYSCTCFEHCYVHLHEDNCINTASGIVTLCR